jgi:hypothetical protein
MKMVPCFIFGRGRAALMAAAACSAMLCSCATPKPRETSIYVPMKSVPERRESATGLKGSVVLADESGKELSFGDREKILVNIVPVREEKRIEEKALVLNPGQDGSFQVRLKEGEYFFEVFLKGFHVESRTVLVRKGSVLDLGAVKITRISTGGAAPVMGDKREEPPPNVGDVNIQPPVS